MGRPRKYKTGVAVITLSLDSEVLEALDRRAGTTRESRSGFINQVLTHFALSDDEFLRMKLRESAQELYYWEGRIKAQEGASTYPIRESPARSLQRAYNRAWVGLP